jgi:hypothetical protein
MSGTMMALLLILLVCASCAAPTTSAGSYRDKAEVSAQAMIGVIGVAQLAITLDLEGRSLATVTDLTVSDAEADANSVVTAFDSRQPPDPQSAQLMKTIDQPLQGASSSLSTLRIAVREGDQAAMRKTVQELRKYLVQLKRMQRKLS